MQSSDPIQGRNACSELQRKIRVCTGNIIQLINWYTKYVMKLMPALSACVLFLASWVIVLLPAEAASLYIDPGMSTLNRGDAITMAIRLDTDEEAGECVNAVDGVLTYSTNIEPVDVSVGDSIFSIWVEQPVINRDERTITFAGGIPNGYCGRVIGDPRLTNILAKIVFRSPGFSIGGGEADENKAVIEFTNESTAYLNDGKGTKAPLTTFGASIELNPRAGGTMVNEWKDEVTADQFPPEEFSIDLIRGDGNYSNKYYITFRTTDKQTGIDHYEVMEEPLSSFGSFQWGRADAPWLIPEVQHVYVLKDQSLNSTIRVKAIDKAGNEYTSVLIPDESLRSALPTEEKTLYSMLWLAILVLLGVAFYVGWFIWKRKKKDSQEKNDSEVSETNEEETEIEQENQTDETYDKE